MGALWWPGEPARCVWKVRQFTQIVAAPVTRHDILISGIPFACSASPDAIAPAGRNLQRD
jgi:hypothetical protein